MARSARSRSPLPPATPRSATGPHHAAPSPAWVSGVVGALFLAVYLAWAPHASGDRDSSEFTVVLATLGLAHPTGYPLYTVLGHAFVRVLHALGSDWAYAANAWSAVGGALAIGLWHAFGSRLLARAGVAWRPAAAVALLPAALFGLAPAWAAQVTVAEVNSWHGAWVAAACLFAWVTLCDLPARARDGAWRAGRAWGWALLVGLGVAHHATSVLVALPLTLALLVAAGRPRRALVLPALGALLVPVLAWSYVLYRSLHPAAEQWGSLGPGLRETWDHVTAAGYRHYLGRFAPSPAERLQLTREVWPVLVPALLAHGAWTLTARGPARVAARALLGAALLQVAYALFYGVSDPVPYFLPAQAIALFVLPAAVASLPVARRIGPALAAAAALLLLPLAWRWQVATIDQRLACEKADDYLLGMWRAVPLRHGWVLWDDDMCPRLVQYQLLAHAHAGLTVVRPLLLMDDGARALWTRRHGFDPLGGAPAPSDDAGDTPAGIEAFATTVGAGINRASRDSVIVFRPETGQLELLAKPAR